MGAGGKQVSAGHMDGRLMDFYEDYASAFQTRHVKHRLNDVGVK